MELNVRKAETGENKRPVKWLTDENRKICTSEFHWHPSREKMFGPIKRERRNIECGKG